MLSDVGRAQDLLDAHTRITRAGRYNFETRQHQLNYTTGLNHKNFRALLGNYYDKQICEFIQYGWPIGHNGMMTRCDATKNHTGARQFPEQVDSYINAEVNLGRIIGPFRKNPFTTQIAISPLNSLEKKNTTDRRVITDLSFPEQYSVNCGINKDVYLGENIQTRYPTVDNIIDIINAKGRGCMLFKRDMKKAFRQIRVDPGDIHLLSFKWNGLIYVDTVLAMGLRSAAYICQRLTNSVTFICREKGFDLVNYLDDFCGVEVPARAQEAFTQLGELLRYLGIEEAKNKAAIPSTRVAFLGIWFDTEKLTMEVTPERLIEIRQLSQEWLKKKKASVREVQSIIGKLNFVAKCVRPARIFISRMLNFLREMPKKGKSKLPKDFRADIQWWNRYLPNFNGVSVISNEKWSRPDEIIASDACLKGCGATCGTEYFHEVFPEHVISKDLHINALELMALVVAVTVWADHLRGKRVIVLCDNSATVWVINTGKTRDHAMQGLLRELCYITATYEFELFAQHIPGDDNRIPDMLSRWTVSEELKEQFKSSEAHKFTRELHIKDSMFVFDSVHW